MPDTSGISPATTIRVIVVALVLTHGTETTA